MIERLIFWNLGALKYFTNHAAQTPHFTHERTEDMKSFDFLKVKDLWGYDSSRNIFDCKIRKQTQTY